MHLSVMWKWPIKGLNSETLLTSQEQPAWQLFSGGEIFCCGNKLDNKSILFCEVQANKYILPNW